MPKTAETQRGAAPVEHARQQAASAPVPENLSGLFGGRGTRQSRIDAGKSARRLVPRAQLAICTLVDRNPIALLEASNAGRLPNLIPIRYGRMVANSFAFYRGGERHGKTHQKWPLTTGGSSTRAVSSLIGRKPLG